MTAQEEAVNLSAQPDLVAAVLLSQWRKAEGQDTMNSVLDEIVPGLPEAASNKLHDMFVRFAQYVMTHHAKTQLQQDWVRRFAASGDPDFDQKEPFPE